MPPSKVRRNKGNKYRTSWRETTTKSGSLSQQKAIDPVTSGMTIDLRTDNDNPATSDQPRPISKKANKPANRAKPTNENYRSGGKTVSMTKGSSPHNPGKDQSRYRGWGKARTPK